MAVALLGLGASPALAQGFCNSCHDFNTYNGWFVSPDLSCRNLDCPTWMCPKNCFSAGPTERFAEQLHPGLIAQQRAGRLYVAAVLPGSPAKKAGIEPGDQLVSINGTRAGYGLEATTWDSGGARAYAELTVAHGGRQINVKLALEPVAVILANAWDARTTEKGALVVPASLSENRSAVTPSGPFAVGFRWENLGDHLRVTDVIATSSSSRLRVGDRILAVDGVRISEMQPADLGRLWAASSSLTFRIEVVNAGRRREIDIRADGMSTLLRGLALSTSQHGSTVALAKSSE